MPKEKGLMDSKPYAEGLLKLFEHLWSMVGTAAQWFCKPERQGKSDKK
jgi:hypothetical protein